MADSKSWTREVRFLLPPGPDELLEAYVFTECPDFHPAHGWRHKTFGKSVSMKDVLLEIAQSKHLTEWSVGGP